MFYSYLSELSPFSGCSFLCGTTRPRFCAGLECVCVCLCCLAEVPGSYAKELLQVSSGGEAVCVCVCMCMRARVC